MGMVYQLFAKQQLKLENNMFNNVFLIRAFIVLTYMFLFVYETNAEAVHRAIFESIEKLQAEADAENASVLAPNSYRQAMASLKKAESLFKKQSSLMKISRSLKEGEKYFQQALKYSRLAKITFSSAIKVRNDAIKADADTLSKGKWKKASKDFIAATRDLEENKISKAKKKADRAERGFRAAELEALKASYWKLAKTRLSEAEALEVSRYAPITFKRAVSLLNEAEKKLEGNPDDADYPRSLVLQSEYEFRHAVYLAKKIVEIKNSKMTLEELFLELEKPVADIAANLGISAEFDKGFDQPVKEITARIESLQADVYEYGELKKKVGFLENDVVKLEGTLGIQSKRIELEEEKRKKMNRIRTLLPQTKVITLAEGENIILSIVGLSFESGSSSIKPSLYPLLKKVLEVVSIMPDYDIVVAGHTDSFGSDAQNLALSLSRARAIEQYLLANSPTLDKDRIISQGFGETKPIANNETAIGRAKNRRIDLVFRPRY